MALFGAWPGLQGHGAVSRWPGISVDDDDDETGAIDPEVSKKAPALGSRASLAPGTVLTSQAHCFATPGCKPQDRPEEVDEGSPCLFGIGKAACLCWSVWLDRSLGRLLSNTLLGLELDLRSKWLVRRLQASTVLPGRTHVESSDT